MKDTVTFLDENNDPIPGVVILFEATGEGIATTNDLGQVKLDPDLLYRAKMIGFEDFLFKSGPGATINLVTKVYETNQVEVEGKRSKSLVTLLILLAIFALLNK